jgi:hypothetical protein
MEESRMQNIDAQIIKPFQRICRYPLLLKVCVSRRIIESVPIACRIVMAC